MNLTRQPIHQKGQKAVRGTTAARLWLERVKGLPCVICKAPGPSDAHHVYHDRYGRNKASDFDTIPLCKHCHQDGPESVHKAKATWRAKHGPDWGYLPLVRAMLDTQDTVDF